MTIGVGIRNKGIGLVVWVNRSDVYSLVLWCFDTETVVYLDVTHMRPNPTVNVADLVRYQSNSITEDGGSAEIVLLAERYDPDLSAVLIARMEAQAALQSCDPKKPGFGLPSGTRIPYWSN